jgi:hypothetical protein
MKRPKQQPAVERKSSRCASIPYGCQVTPQVNWWEFAKAAAGTAGSLASLGQSIWGQPNT